MSANLKPEQSGLYRAPSKLRPLAGEVRSSTVDLSAARDKAGLLDAFAQGLELPPGFGQNWDALADALQDLGVPPAGYVLHLRQAAAAERALGAEWGMVVEILVDAAMYWKAHGRPFVVLLEGTAGLPEWR